jgi:ubiquitin-protein ligase E3 A
MIIHEVFDPQNAMFVQLEDRALWINSASLETDREYELVGILFGLAIYNGVILDVQFPMVVYKKLLGCELTLADLWTSHPTLARGLQQLLEYDGDVEYTFCRTFRIDEERFGHRFEVDLVPDGDNIDVTNENRAEFVRLYVENVLVASVQQQFDAFSRGFHLVCGGPALMLFLPEELEMLLCGNSNLDFHDLEATTTYDDGYNPDTPAVRWLWEVVHSMDIDNQRRFLKYVTGSDRVPIKGLSSLKMVIQRNGEDSVRLPTALTCFSRLLLPEYANKDKLEDRLALALEHGKGFGLA